MRIAAMRESSAARYHAAFIRWEATMDRVTGMGGFFVKCADAKRQIDWYRKHLGIPINADYGGWNFEWRNAEDPKQKGMTVFSLFPDSTEYFGPSPQRFMFNFRVKDLDALYAFGPRFHETSRVSAIIAHNKPDEAMALVIQGLAKKFPGSEWIGDEEVPAFRANIDKADRAGVLLPRGLSITPLDGGKGSDTFQIGQLFGEQRNLSLGRLVEGDDFSTICTTRGSLSRGTSMPLVATGAVRVVATAMGAAVASSAMWLVLARGWTAVIATRWPVQSARTFAAIQTLLFGIGILLRARQVRKMIATYVGENKDLERQFLGKELDV
jgi:hypothetical protein